MIEFEIKITPFKLIQEDLEKDLITTIEKIKYTNGYVVTSRKYISNPNLNHKSWEGFNRYFFTNSIINHYIKEGKMKVIEYANEFGQLIKPVSVFGF